MTDKEYIKSDLKAFMKELLETLKGRGYSPFLQSKENPEGRTDGLTPKTLNKILMKIANTEKDDELYESLRDWFKKEKWVRISSSGDIAGPCGTSKNKKNPDRCLPKAKAQSLSKAERAATARKKKQAGAKGKTVVKNTKKAKVTRETLEKLVWEVVTEKDDRCTRLAKARFDTWPSAYASGFVVRCRQGKIMKKKK